MDILKNLKKASTFSIKRNDRSTIILILSASFIFILVMVLMIGILVFQNMSSMRTITQDLYIHPFAVSNASMEIKSSIFQLRVHMLKFLVFDENIHNTKEWIQEAELLNSNINKNMVIVKANFLGDKNKVKQLENLLEDWTDIRKKIFDSYLNKDIKKTEKLIKEDATNKLNEIIPFIDYVTNFARNRARLFVEEADSTNANKIFNIWILGSMLIFFILVIGFVTINRIVTLNYEKDNIFLQLQENKEHLRVMYDNTKVGIAFGDPNGNLISFNSSFSEILEYDKYELIGKNFESFTHPDDLKIEKNYFEKIIKKEIASYTLEKRYITKLNNIVWVLLNVSAIFESDQVKYFIAVIDQIDEIKQTQFKLTQSENQFRQLAENIEHVLWLATADKMLYVSPAFEKVFGQKVEDLYMDRTYFMKSILEEDKQKVLLALRNAYTNSTDFNEEYRITHPEKGIRWIWARTFIIKNDEALERRSVGIAQDITDKKMFEEQIQNSLKREIELNQLKSNLVSLVSHQFRTPLTTIKSSIQILESYNDDIQDKIRAHFQRHFYRITTEVDRLNSMIEDSMTINKIEMGKYPFRPELTNIIELIDELLSEKFESNPNNCKVIVTNFGTIKPVMLDKNLVNHIISNLISNALKYSKGCPEIKVVFEKDRLEIEVKDDGMGIPLAEQRNLFQYFFRASNVTNITGTGLGLRVVKEFMDLHNGKIELESELNKGTKIKLVFPVESHE